MGGDVIFFWGENLDDSRKVMIFAKSVTIDFSLTGQSASEYKSRIEGRKHLEDIKD